MRVVESNWKEPPPCFWKVIAWVAESSRGQEIGSPRVHKGQVGSQSNGHKGGHVTGLSQ